jgi:hypothetical protein
MSGHHNKGTAPPGYGLQRRSCDGNTIETLHGSGAADCQQLFEESAERANWINEMDLQNPVAHRGRRIALA